MKPFSYYFKTPWRVFGLVTALIIAADLATDFIPDQALRVVLDKLLFSASMLLIAWPLSFMTTLAAVTLFAFMTAILEMSGHYDPQRMLPLWQRRVALAIVWLALGVTLAVILQLILWGVMGPPSPIQL